MTSRPYFNSHRQRWQAAVELGRDGNGKRPQIFRDMPKEKNTKAEAKRVGRLLLNELEAGTFVAPSDLTVAEHLESWLADVVCHQVGARTRDRYEGIVRTHLIPRLGGVKLSALRPDQVQRCYAEMLDAGLAPPSVRKAHVVMHSALRHAVRMRLIARNPSDDLMLPKVRRPEIKALTDEQVGAMLTAAQGSRVAVPLLVLVSLGVRRGELLALQWADVDLEARTVSARRTLEESSAGVHLKQPKTARSSRTIALPASTVAALRTHHAAQQRARLAGDKAFNKLDLVFPGRDGEPWKPSAFASNCRTVFKKAGLTCRLHDLRHTQATMLLRQGVHPKVVQERLGHANVSITLDIYSHCTANMQQEAAAKIDEALAAALAG
jgi:integrase